jgi:hypothetical protein
MANPTNTRTACRWVGPHPGPVRLDGVVMSRSSVGELYAPGRPELPEGASWRLSPAGVELLISLAEPTQAEIDAVGGQTGPPVHTRHAPADLWMAGRGIDPMVDAPPAEPVVRTI